MRAIIIVAGGALLSASVSACSGASHGSSADDAGGIRDGGARGSSGTGGGTAAGVTGGNAGRGAGGAGGSHAAGAGAAGKPSAQDAGPADAGGGDELGPWAGGPAYYAQFSHGPPADDAFFPITVWLQNPDRAADYAAIGINTYLGLWQGPTDAQLSVLSKAGMPVACDQNSVGLAHLSDPTIVSWMQDDEPDNAQPASGGGYGPCVSASTVVDRYTQMKSKDGTRPVFLNLGQGVAHNYIGWGSECAATHPGDYPSYIAGADIVSFDIYPSNDTSADVMGKLWLVADGVKNLVQWGKGKKPVWNFVECTGIDAPSGKPTPVQVKAEVWMSIVSGSMGVGYFVHQFKPTSDEHALLDDSTMKAAVGAINKQIHDLAPVLNTPPITNGGSVTSSTASVPVEMLLKRKDGATYIFAVAMRGTATHATFSGLTRIAGGARVTVIGENRQLTLSARGFEDDFDAWGVHLYEIR